MTVMSIRARLLRAYGRVTSGLRVLPDFIIIGAQRAGTTSLYNYLARHPNVLPAFSKEIHFFDRYFYRGINWYRSFFPLGASKRRSGSACHCQVIVGESTPYYLFHPHAPKRAHQIVPYAKLIVLLRNPIDRAYSHYNHEVRIGAESLTFEEALEREKKVLPRETAKMIRDESYYSFHHQHHSYLTRGIYLPQLLAWREFFPQEQMLIINSEALYDSPQTVMDRVQGFLGLSRWRLNNYHNYNSLQYQRMDGSIRARLVAYFRPHNSALYEYLGVNFGWDE